MAVNDNELINAFNELFIASFQRTFSPCRLGIFDTSTSTYRVEVPDRPGYLYIRKGDDGTLGEGIARDAVGVNIARTNQRLGVRKEGHDLVIRQAEFLVGSGGGGGSTITSLDDIPDVDVPGAVDGDLLMYDAGTDTWIPFTPTGTTGDAPSPHALDSSHHSGQLADSQFLNALLKDGSRPLTGNLSVNTGITIDGVDIDAHAIGNPDAHHAQATSGNTGITVTGQAVSLNLGTDGGLEFGGGGVRVKLNTNPGIVRDSNGLYLDSAIAGGGLAMSGSRVLSVNVKEGVEIDADSLRVNLAFNYSWTGNHTFSTGVTRFNTDPQVNADLDFIGAARTITNVAGNITVRPTGDLLLNPTNIIQFGVDKTMQSGNSYNDLPTGITGFRLFRRTEADYYQLTIGAFKADELYVRVFVADETRIDRGEEYWSKSFGVVEEDFLVPAGGSGSLVNVWFENAAGVGTADLFSVNDWLLFRGVDWGSGLVVFKAWFQVNLLQTAGSVDGLRQRWSLRYRSGSTPGFKIKKGTVALDAGVVGQGWIHLSALVQDGGPFVQLGSMTSAVIPGPPVFTNRVRIGNLDGVAGLSGAYWGLAAGNNLGLNPSLGGFSGVVITDVDGLKLYNTELNLYVSGTLQVSLNNDSGLSIKHDTTLSANEVNGIHWYENVSTQSGAHSLITSVKDGSGMNQFFMQHVATGSDHALVGLTATGGPAGFSGAVRASSSGGVYMEHFGTGANHSSLQLVELNLVSKAHLIPLTDLTFDLGTASFRWRAIYVDQLNAGTISGATLSGSEWEFAGSMIIDANSASNTLLTVTNQGTGRADLDVDRNITLGGTVDGVDIAAFSGSYDAHVANTAIHVGASTAGAGLAHASGVLSVNAATGLTISGDNVILASTAAGTGLVYTSGVLSLSTALGGLGLTYSAGVLNIDPALAGEGLDYDGVTGIMSLDSAIAGLGLDYTAGVIDLASSIAGNGLDFSAGVLSLDLASTGGLQIVSTELAINLGEANTGSNNPGLEIDATGIFVKRRGDAGLNSGLTITSADGLYLADTVAGAGLIWELSTERILSVGAGAGIAVATNAVSIDLGTNSGLNTSSGLVVDPSIAGAGLTLTAGVLSVNATTGLAISGDNVILHSSAAGTGLSYTSGILAVNAASGLTTSGDNVIVNLAYDFVWGGDHTFPLSGLFQVNSIARFNNNINFLGSARSITAAGVLTIAPTGDLILNPTGLVTLAASQEMRSATYNDLVTGIDGFRLFERSDVANYYQLTIGAFKADELYVRVFVADEVRIDRGEEYWSKSYGVVESDFQLPADEANVSVWFENAPGLAAANLFTVGDWLLLRSIDWDTGLAVYKMWFTVVSLVTAGSVDGYRQRWSIKRESGGPAAGFTIKKGVTMLDAGQVGQGWIHLSALSQDNGPFIQIGDMTSIVSSDTPAFTNRVRMGNISGVAGVTGTVWGFAAGDNLGSTPSTGFSGFTVGKGIGSPGTNYDGLRLYNIGLAMYTGSNKDLSLTQTNGLIFDIDTGDLANLTRYVSWWSNVDSYDALSQAYIGAYQLSSVNHLVMRSKSNVADSRIEMYAEGNAGYSLLSIRPSQMSFTVDGVEFLNAALTGVYVPNPQSFGVRIAAPVSPAHIYENTSATGAAAGVTIEQDGASGDAVLHFLLTGGQTWSVGIDNSVSGDSFRISASADLTTTPLLTLSTAGTLTLSGGITGVDSITAGASGIQFIDDASNTMLKLIDGGKQVVVGANSIVEPYSGYTAQNNVALFVRQSTSTAATTPYASIVVSNNQTDTTDGNIATFDFMNEAESSAAKRAGQMLVQTDGALNSGQYLFRTFNAGTLVECMILKSTGFIGMGTTTPGVDVVGTFDIPTTNTLLQLDGSVARLLLRGSATALFQLIDTGAAANVKMAGMQNNNGFTNFITSDDTGTTVFTPFSIDHSSGYMGINSSAPVAQLEIDQPSGADGLKVSGYALSPTIVGRRAQGSKGSPTAVGVGHVMLQIAAQGRISGAWPSEGAYSAYINLLAEETHTSTAKGTAIAFYVTASGTNTQTQAVYIPNDGVMISNPIYSNTVAVVPNMSISSSGRITRTTHANSSIRYKENIHYLAENAYEGLLQNLRPVSYQLKEGDGKRLVGVIAEDLDAVGGKDFIQYDEQGRPDAVMYDRLVMLLVNEVKSLRKELDELKYQNRRLN